MRLSPWWPTPVLVRKELISFLARPLFWVSQLVVLAGLSGVAILRVHEVVNAGSAELRTSAEHPGTLLAACVLTASLLVAPFLTAGVLRDEAERGTLELLLATPISQRSIFTSLLVARLILIGLLVVATLPILYLPDVLLGGSSSGTWLRLGLACMVGASLVALFALREAARETPTVVLWTQVAVFIVVTPLVFGRVAPWRLVLIVALCLCIGSCVPEVRGLIPYLILALLPLMGLLLDIQEAVPARYTLLSWGSALVLLPILAIEARHSLAWWLSGRLERKTVRRQRRTHGFELGAARRRLLERLLGRTRESGPAAAHEDPATELAPSEGGRRCQHLLACRTLRALGPLARMAYHRSRHNPLVVKHLFQGSNADLAVGVVLPVIFFFGVWPGLLLIGTAPTEWFLGQLRLFQWFFLLLLPPGLVRLLPAGRGARRFDLLATTPITGFQVVQGACVVSFLHGGALLLLILLGHLLLLSEESIPWVLTSALGACAQLFLVAGVALWSSTLLRSTTARLLATWIILAALTTGLWMTRIDRPPTLWCLASWALAALLLVSHACSFDLLLRRR